MSENKITPKFQQPPQGNTPEGMDPIAAMEVTIEPDSNGVISVYRHGQLMVCPYKPILVQHIAPSLAQPGIGPQAQQVMQSCNSICPHFEIKELTERPTPMGGNHLVAEPKPYLGLLLSCGCPKTYRVLYAGAKQ